jgi:hypothetical protein
MTKVLKVTDLSTTVDFKNGDLVLAFEGWETETNDDVIWEVIKLVSDAADANIRSTAETLDKLRQAAILYFDDPLREAPVWFYWQSEGESVKRALVQDIKTKIKSFTTITPLLGENMAVMEVAIKRSAFYESDSVSSKLTTGISCFGGTWSPAATRGSVPGRISSFSIESSVTLGANPADDYYIGIKDTRKGAGGFVALWEAEDAGGRGDDCSLATDADASPGGGGNTKVTCDFATNSDLAYRVAWVIDDILGGNFDDMIGKYLILARMKIAPVSTVVRVQLRHGWSYLTSNAEGEIAANIYMNGNEDSSLVDWQFLPLGEIQIPGTGNRDDYAVINNLIQYYGLSVYAERVSAGGNWAIDCLVLMPTDHMIACKGAVVGDDGGGNPVGKVTFRAGPDGFKSIINEEYTSGVLVDMNNQITDPEFRDWNYPVEDGIVVVCGRDAIVGGTINPTLQTYPRWRGFRT